MILVTIITTVFLEVIWSSSQTVSWIEASNAAYYQASWLIEEQLIHPLVTKKSPWNIQPKIENFALTWRTLNVFTGSNIMPANGRWNSPYDINYNIITLGDPLQIVIPEWIDWNSVNFEFRVPKIDTSVSTWVSLNLANSWIILWTLWYIGSSLYASGETNTFVGSDINDPIKKISAFYGNTSNPWTNIQFNSFYADSTNQYLWTSWVKCVNYACTLKLSMIRPITTSDGRSLPFLEYRITFNKVIPAQFMILDSVAYSYWFQRNRSIRIPQVTTNTALDFAVLQ